MYDQLVTIFCGNMMDASANCYGTVTTKEAAEHLGISTPKAYAFLKELEAQNLAYNIGIKVKWGYEPSDGIGTAKTKSITWQIYSK